MLNNNSQQKVEQFFVTFGVFFLHQHTQKSKGGLSHKPGNSVLKLVKRI